MAITQSGYRDAQTTNASNRSVRLYKDLALSFERNDNTKDMNENTKNTLDVFDCKIRS